MNTPWSRRSAAIGLLAMTVVAAGCSPGGSDGAIAEVAVTDVAVTTVSEVVTQTPDTAAVADDAGNEDVVAGEKDVVTRSFEGDGDATLPDGFGSVTARVTSIDGDVCEACLWLADDDALRQRGLMGVTDLGNAVGMAFRWEQPRSGNFFMFQTPTPLSIAWFDAAGSHVGQADMDPCMVDNSTVCERYTSDAPYVLAVEMFGGQLDKIGIGPGASIELLDLPCTAIPG